MTVPRVFGLPHLSEDAVAAFADGVLTEAATSRARRHCLECSECADAVRGQRETAMMLRTASAPALPAGLLDRLAGLPMSAPLPPPRSGLPTALGADGVPVFVAYNPANNNAAARPTPEVQDDGPQPGQHHRRVLLPVTIFASAAAVLAAGALGGNISAPQPGAEQSVSANATTFGSAGFESSNDFQDGATALGQTVTALGLGSSAFGSAAFGSAAFVPSRSAVLATRHFPAP